MHLFMWWWCKDCTIISNKIYINVVIMENWITLQILWFISVPEGEAEQAEAAEEWADPGFSGGEELLKEFLGSE